MPFSAISGTLLKSTWVVRVPQGTTKITVRFAAIEVNEEDGSTQVWYPTFTEENLKTGYIANEEFGRGATKLVYKVQILGCINVVLLNTSNL